MTRRKLFTIGASQVGALLNVGKYRSARNQMLEILRKTQLPMDCQEEEEETRIPQHHLLHGREMEPLARKKLSQLLETPIHEMGTLFCWREPRLCASPDGIIFDHSSGLHVGCEIKCPVRQDNPKSWPDHPEEIHCDYIMQCVVNMEVFGSPKWYLFYYHPGPPEKYRCFVVYRNQNFFINHVMPVIRRVIYTTEDLMSFNRLNQDRFTEFLAQNNMETAQSKRGKAQRNFMEQMIREEIHIIKREFFE
jgi:hypothetical protein